MKLSKWFKKEVRPIDVSGALGRPQGNSSRDKEKLTQKIVELEDIAKYLNKKIVIEDDPDSFNL